MFACDPLELVVLVYGGPITVVFVAQGELDTDGRTDNSTDGCNSRGHFRVIGYEGKWEIFCLIHQSYQRAFPNDIYRYVYSHTLKRTSELCRCRHNARRRSTWRLFCHIQGPLGDPGLSASPAEF